MTEDNKALARRFYEEIFNKGNLDVAGEIVAPDFVLRDPNMPEEIHGPEGLKQFATAYRNAFPDLHIEVQEQVADEHRVASRFVARGTHEGELMGIAPTGREVEIGACTLHRVSEGKISEDWANYDALGMMRQLGVVS